MPRRERYGAQHRDSSLAADPLQKAEHELQRADAEIRRLRSHVDALEGTLRTVSKLSSHYAAVPSAAPSARPLAPSFTAHRSSIKQK